MHYFKKLLLLLPVILTIFTSLTINNILFAKQEDIDVDYYIIPKIKEDSVKKIQDATKEIGMTGGSVMSTYNEKAKELTPEEQRNSGIMTRNAIINYLKFVIKFLSQFGLLTGVGFIMFAGYKYMISALNGNSSADKSMVINAIIGVIIIIFSYAIMKTLTSIVGLS